MHNAPAHPGCYVCGKQFVDRAYFFCLSKFAEYAASSASPNILLSILVCSGECATRYLRESRPHSSGPEPHYDGFSRPASVAPAATQKLPAPINAAGKTQEKLV